MAVLHLAFGENSAHGSQLRNDLRSLENGLNGIKDRLATMALMIDGNGSDAAHFTYLTDKFGFADNATAKAAYEELQSCYSKLSGNGSVTNVNAALLQAFNKFR